MLPPVSSNSAAIDCAAAAPWNVLTLTVIIALYLSAVIAASPWRWRPDGRVSLYPAHSLHNRHAAVIGRIVLHGDDRARLVAGQVHGRDDRPRHRGERWTRGGLHFELELDDRIAVEAS